MKKPYTKETICIQSGWKPGNGEPRVLPIYQSTTYKYETSEQMGRLFDLEENGYDDWRLPRLSELAFIYVNQESLKALRGFTPLSGTYWCGSEFQEGTTDEQRKKSESAWAVDFTGATTAGYASHHKKAETLKIRCVRQQQDNPSLKKK